MREPDLVEQLRRPRDALAARPSPRPSIGSWTFSAAVSVGIRLWNWKTKPTTVARYARPVGVADPLAGDGDLPAVGRSSAPIRFSSVLLPHPDGPVTATNSPSSTRKETSTSAAMLPVLERAGDVVDDDLGAAVSAAHRALTQ